MATKQKYEGLSLSQLISKIAKSRYWDLPTMLGVALEKLSGQGGGDSRPYKVYSGLITQTGTNNPVITVLENTLGTVSCTRYDVGRGFFESSGLFVTGKTWLYLNEVHNYAPGGSFNQNIGLIHQINTNFVALESGIISGGVVTSADGIFNNTSFEIRVYN